jgi:type IV secretory pathway VirB10-like protein
MKYLIFLLCLVFSVAGAAAEPWNGPTERRQSTRRYYMPTGFTFDVVLKTAIFSFNTNTPVIAETEFDVTYLGKVMIPKGARLIGTSAIEKTDDRVNVNFHTIVFPNGEEIKFTGLALWTDGSAGIKGKKDTKKAAIPVKVILSAAASGAAAASNTSVPNEMVKSIAADAQADVAAKQEVSISVPKDIGILVYIVDRTEY